MAGSVFTFAPNHGFVEAKLRGLRKSFLTDAEYAALRESETIDDMVSNLQDTDYGNWFVDEDDPSAPVDPRTIEPKSRAKAAEEFLHVRCDAVEPLATFMDFCMHEFMIDLVLEILQLSAQRHNLTEDEFKNQLEEILTVRSHPLGRFDSSVAKSITAFGTSESEIRELYASVLVETPVGHYFERYFLEEAEGAGGGVVSDAELDASLTDQPMARLEHGVMRLWLEEFAEFCENIGGETAEQMRDILGARASALTVSITYNSLRTEFSAAAVRADFRNACFPRFGPLYPEGCLALAQVGTSEELARALAPFPGMTTLWNRAPEDSDGDRRIHDVLLKRDVFYLQRAFEGQAHLASAYAYLALKEVEARNLGWIARQIRTRGRDFERIIIPFSKEANVGPAATGLTTDP